MQALPRGAGLVPPLLGLVGAVRPAAVLQVALVLHLSLHGGVPVILDGVVRPAGSHKGRVR